MEDYLQTTHLQEGSVAEFLQCDRVVAYALHERYVLYGHIYTVYLILYEHSGYQGYQRQAAANLTCVPSWLNRNA